MNDDGYPDEPVGPFPGPPRTITDGRDRTVSLRAVGPGPDEIDRATAREALTEMYVAFDPADRAQGLPPAGEDRVRDWLGTVLGPDCANVVALVGDESVGHATLVPDDGAAELAIFVHQDHREAGIGTALIRTLLGLAAEEGIERIWLTVERWNRAAVGLYRKLGFETRNGESFELEMSIRLAAD
jgi:ribosomal protein S18 acetylase RimI-like enzyme